MAPHAVVHCQRLDGQVALVTLNRPEVRNAVNGELARALEAIVLDTEADPDVWGVVLTAAGGLIRLPRALPRKLALELAMTGDPMDARRAELHGLVNRVVPVDSVVDEALALARRINRNAPLAVRESLQSARVAAELSQADARALTLAARERVTRSKDYQEGPRAFIEKRAPRWTGR